MKTIAPINPLFNAAGGENPCHLDPYRPVEATGTPLPSSLPNANCRDCKYSHIFKEVKPDSAPDQNSYHPIPCGVNIFISWIMCAPLSLDFPELPVE